MEINFYVLLLKFNVNQFSILQQVFSTSTIKKQSLLRNYRRKNLDDSQKIKKAMIIKPRKIIKIIMIYFYHQVIIVYNLR